MKRSFVVLLAAAACVAAPLAAQEPDLTVVPPVATDYRAEQTAWGEPDFRGGWPIDHLTAVRRCSAIRRRAIAPS